MSNWKIPFGAEVLITIFGIIMTFTCSPWFSLATAAAAFLGGRIWQEETRG